VSRIEPELASAEDWRATARSAADTVVAGALLALTSPLWPALWLEARLRGKHEWLVREGRVGTSRRSAPRRGAGADVPIDRRAIERRTLDLLGRSFHTLRFRADTGPLSRWVHRRRLDQVPYLLNVLRHEMTLVGPAPETPDEVLRRTGLVPDYARRFSVLPGVTGLAQISGEDQSDAETLVRRAHYDLYYVDNASWLLDLRTMARALRLTLAGPGHGATAASSASAQPGERTANG